MANKGMSPKRTALALGLALLGAGYFGAFSSLEIYAGIKPLVTLFPVQVGLLVYLLWWRKRGQRLEQE